MGRGVTIFRVGAVVFLVGHALVGCPRPADPAVALAPPDLVIPPLDGGATPPPSPSGGGVRFAHPAPIAGTWWTVLVHASSHSSDDAGGDQVSTYDSEFRVEVLAVDGPVPSRVKLRFSKNAHAYQGNPVPTVIEGKEYTVDAHPPHVRDATNAAAPEDEAQRVLDVFPDLGTRTRIDEVLPDDAMHIGERRDELAAAVLRVIHPRAWTLRTGNATLVRVDGDHAVFRVSIDATSDTGLVMELSGEAQVRLHDARLSDLTLDGRYELKRAGTSEPPGTFSLRRRITSEAAPRIGR